MSSLKPGGGDNFVASALSALSIGIWSWQGSPGNVRCCPVAARMFGVSPSAGEHGLPLERFAQSVHPDDRSRFLTMIAEACQQGGAFAAEYRTLRDDRTTRWILDHGAFQKGPSGQVTAACGIVIDMTDRLDRKDFRSSAFFAPHVRELTPLEQAAEHAMALHELMVSIPSEEAKRALSLTNQILQLLAREIVNSIGNSNFSISPTTRDGMH